MTCVIEKPYISTFSAETPSYPWIRINSTSGICHEIGPRIENMTVWRGVLSKDQSHTGKERNERNTVWFRFCTFCTKQIWLVWLKNAL